MGMMPEIFNRAIEVNGITLDCWDEDATPPKKVYADLGNTVYSADRNTPAKGVGKGQIEQAPATESEPGVVY